MNKPVVSQVPIECVTMALEVAGNPYFIANLAVFLDQLMDGRPGARQRFLLEAERIARKVWNETRPEWDEFRLLLELPEPNTENGGKSDD